MIALACRHDPRVQRSMQFGSLFFAEIVVGTYQLNHLAFGQIGWLVEDQTTVTDAGFERLHRQEK